MDDVNGTGPSDSFRWLGSQVILDPTELGARRTRLYHEKEPCEGSFHSPLRRTYWRLAKISRMRSRIVEKLSSNGMSRSLLIHETAKKAANVTIKPMIANRIV